MTTRTCHFCHGAIPDDEKAIEANTKNAWAHFECWYSGPPPFRRDKSTGARQSENGTYATQAAPTAH